MGGLDIRMRGVACRHGRNEAVADVDLEIAAGERVALTGTNGSGKTTLLRALLGLHRQVGGTIEVDAELKIDLYHVRSDFARYMEVQVDVRRHHTAPEMTSELEYILIRRARQLRNENRSPEHLIRAPLGAEQSLELAYRMRAFDVWVHEQDLRFALGVPGNLDSAGAHVTRDVLLEALPKVVAKDAGAPASSAVVVDVSGPLEFLRTVRVDAEGRGSIDGAPSLGPAVTLATDWETFVRLACGRVRPAEVADRVKTEGDEALAQAILDNFAVTPR